MSLSSVFDVAGLGMSAQTVRLNTVASNLANADAVAPSEAEVYRARHPVFRATQVGASGRIGEGQEAFGVMVDRIIESEAPANRRYQPDHTLADEQGYVFYSNVNSVEEMADMISAQRSFTVNVEVFNTAKTMLQKTLTMGQ